MAGGQEHEVQQDQGGKAAAVASRTIQLDFRLFGACHGWPISGVSRWDSRERMKRRPVHQSPPRNCSGFAAGVARATAP